MNKTERLDKAAATSPHPQKRQSPDHEKHKKDAVAAISKATNPEGRMRAFLLGDVANLSDILNGLESKPGVTTTEIFAVCHALLDDRALDVPEIVHLCAHGPDGKG